jgi:hypothetical protein
MKRTLELFRGITRPTATGTRAPHVQAVTLRARRDGVLWAVTVKVDRETIVVRRPTAQRALRDAAALLKPWRWSESRTEAATQARRSAGWRNATESAGSRDR